MLALGVSDVHSPIWLKELQEEVAKWENKGVDLVLVAGDLTNKGNAFYYRKAIKVLLRLGAKIVAVFGNDEYEEVKDRIRKDNPEVIFLEDESVTLEIGGMEVGIVGSKGSLETPTSWQRRHIPGIEEIYEERVNLVGELLRSLRSDLRILLTHYATTRATMRGENPKIYKFLGHGGYEKYFREGLVDVAVHGHVHNGTKVAKVGSTIIYNVAFPLWKTLVKIESGGLQSFF